MISSQRTISIGHGVGLRREHFGHILEQGPTSIDWMEIISENFFAPGGRPWAVLDRVRKEVPVVMHGVSMAIGNVTGVSLEYLKQLATVIERVEPEWVSDHLCWGGYGGHYAHDLLPLPYTSECLNHLLRELDKVQEFLGRQLVIENPSSYVTFKSSEMSEHEFLAELAQRSGCGLLLDVNNVFVSAKNHDFDPLEYIQSLPADSIKQLHLAGHTDKGSYLLDSHIGPTPDSVWQLYRFTLKHTGPIATLVEWDDEIPEYKVVLAETQLARAIEKEECGYVAA